MSALDCDPSCIEGRVTGQGECNYSHFSRCSSYPGAAMTSSITPRPPIESLVCTSAHLAATLHSRVWAKVPACTIDTVATVHGEVGLSSAPLQIDPVQHCTGEHLQETMFYNIFGSRCLASWATRERERRLLSTYADAHQPRITPNDANAVQKEEMYCRSVEKAVKKHHRSAR